MIVNPQKFDLDEIRGYLGFLAFECDTPGNLCDETCPMWEPCTTLSGEDQNRIIKDTIRLIDAMTEQIDRQDKMLEFYKSRLHRLVELCKELNQGLTGAQARVNKLEDLLAVLGVTVPEEDDEPERTGVLREVRS